MTRWVVTGPAGAGKSSLTRLLSERGAAVVDGDRLGHEILARPAIAARIAARFGERCVRADGSVDRGVLGAKVFADERELAALNAIVHPPLCLLMEERLAELENPPERGLAVLEAAVYFLLPSPPRSDLVVAVTAAPGIRLRRLVAGGLDPARAAERIASQRLLEAAFARADLTIHNDGTPADLAAQAEQLLRRHAPRPTAPETSAGKDGAK